MNDQPASRLLALCARPGFVAGAKDEIPRLAASVDDWDRLLVRAELEGLLPLVYWRLKDAPGPVPAPVLERLGRSFLSHLARSALVYRELEPFLEAVRRAGLRTAMTKGGRLALDIYPEPALRPFWDVDFVVHPADWPSLSKVLDRLGFRPSTNYDEVAAAPALDWTFSPYFRKGPLFLEFHFHSLGLQLSGLREDDFWPSACRLRVRGSEAMVLPAEREFCYLAVHAQQHSYSRLIWLADLAVFAARPGLDWDRIVRLGRAERVAGPVYHGLRLVESLWPGTAPPDALAGLRPGIFERTALRALWPQKAVSSPRRGPDWPYYLPALFSLWERRDPASAARSLAGIFFPPRAWLAASSGLPATSPRLYGRYLGRLMKPVLAAAKRLTAD